MNKLEDYRLRILGFVGSGLVAMGIVFTLDIFQNMSKWHPLWYLQFSPMTLCIGTIMVVYVCDKYWKHNQKPSNEQPINREVKE